MVLELPHQAGVAFQVALNESSKTQNISHAKTI